MWYIFQINPRCLDFLEANQSLQVQFEFTKLHLMAQLWGLVSPSSNVGFQLNFFGLFSP